MYLKEIHLFRLLSLRMLQQHTTIILFNPNNLMIKPINQILSSDNNKKLSFKHIFLIIFL